VIEPAIPADDLQRLASLRALGLLDTRAEERFDRITRLAQRLFGVPPYALSVSIGTSVLDPSAPVGLDDLLATADAAMYEQKQARRRD
jgi:GGDEF domain-containing protein